MVFTSVEERLAVESLYQAWLDRFDVSIQRSKVHVPWPQTENQDSNIVWRTLEPTVPPHRVTIDGHDIKRCLFNGHEYQYRSKVPALHRQWWHVSENFPSGKNNYMISGFCFVKSDMCSLFFFHWRIVNQWWKRHHCLRKTAYLDLQIALNSLSSSMQNHTVIPGIPLRVISEDTWY